MYNPIESTELRGPRVQEAKDYDPTEEEETSTGLERPFCEMEIFRGNFINKPHEVNGWELSLDTNLQHFKLLKNTNFFVDESGC